MPNRESSHVPIRLPTIPIAMSPMKPKPPPDTIFPANHPAMSPTSNMMSKLSADKYILVTRQLGDYELSTALQRIPVKLTHSQHVESSCGILHEKVSE